MIALATPLEQSFAGPPEAVWAAVKVALPTVVQRATFWEQEHRVEWSTDLGPTDWGQQMTVSVEAIDDQCSVVALRGRSRGSPPTMFDPRRRKKLFRALVEGVARALHEHPDQLASAAVADGVRWWNGVTWRDTGETPDPGPPASGHPSPAWYSDPGGRHQLRYWDGKAWSGHVSDDGATAFDPL